MSPVIRAVAIDLDGTLLDTAGDIATAANRALQDIGLSALPVDVVKSFVGKGIHNLVTRAVAAVGAAVDETVLERTITRFEHHYATCFADTTQPFSGVVEGLAAMRNAGFALACVTNKAARFTEPLLMRTGLAGYFSLTLSGDSLPEKKPHPLPLTHSAQHFGITPMELLVIGDSANDLQAARAAGSPIWLVPYGYREGLSADALKPDAWIDSLIHAAERLSSKVV